MGLCCGGIAWSLFLRAEWKDTQDVLHIFYNLATFILAATTTKPQMRHKKEYQINVIAILNVCY